MKYTVEMGSGGFIYIKSFMKIGRGVQAILRFCLSNLTYCNVGITNGGIYEFAVEMGSDGIIYIPSSRTIGSDI
jgi:hypothetical protein